MECGLAGVSNLLSNTLSDRMESFVLSETLKARYFRNPSSPCLIPGPPCSIYTYCLTRKIQSTATTQTTSSRPKDTSLRSNRSTQNPCRLSDGSSVELRTINVPHILLDLLSRNTQTWKGVSWGAYCLVETWSTLVFWQTVPRASWNRQLGHPMGIVTSRRWRFS